MPLIRSNMIVGGQLGVSGQLNARSTLVAEADLQAYGRATLGSGNPEDEITLRMKRLGAYQNRLRVRSMADTDYSLDPYDIQDILLYDRTTYGSASLTMGSNVFYVFSPLIAANLSNSDIPLSIPNLGYSGVLSAHTTYEFLGTSPLGGWNLIAKYSNSF